MSKIARYSLVFTFLLMILIENFSFICRHKNVGSDNDAFVFKPLQEKEDLSDHRVWAASLYNDPISPESTVAATKIQWKQLEDVGFTARFNKEYNVDIMYPVFGDEVKKLAGKELIISGYMIPLDVEEGLYAISRYTYASCFFCGGAGVESVISLKFKAPPRRYRTDQYCTIQGKMELNSTNVNDFIYIFRDAVEIKK